jgi:molecular chaperone DnaK (HSP70)
MIKEKNGAVVKVNEGSETKFSHLGEIEFAGIPPAAKGVPHIEVTLGNLNTVSSSWKFASP